MRNLIAILSLMTISLSAFAGNQQADTANPEVLNRLNTLIDNKRAEMIPAFFLRQVYWRGYPVPESLTNTSWKKYGPNKALVEALDDPSNAAKYLTISWTQKNGIQNRNSNGDIESTFTVTDSAHKSEWACSEQISFATLLPIIQFTWTVEHRNQPSNPRDANEIIQRYTCKNKDGLGGSISIPYGLPNYLRAEITNSDNK